MSDRKDVKIDSQGRATLGKLADHEWYQASRDEDGVITLRPLQLVPVGVLRGIPRPNDLVGQR